MDTLDGIEIINFKSTDIPENSWTFDGNSRIVAEINEPETSISREFVFKTTTSGGLFTVNADSGGNDRHLGIQIDGNIYSHVYSGQDIHSTNINVLDDNIHRLIFTLGGNGTNIYIDGELVANGPKVSSDFHWSNLIVIGDDRGPNGNHNPKGDSPDYFDGEIFSYKQWDEELTFEQATGPASELPEPAHLILLDQDPSLGLTDLGTNPVPSSALVIEGQPSLAVNVADEISSQVLVNIDDEGDYTLTGSSLLEPITLSSDPGIVQEDITGSSLSHGTDGALAEIEAIIQSYSPTDETSDASITNFLYSVGAEDNLMVYAETTLVDPLSLDHVIVGSPNDLTTDDSLEQLLGINDPMDDDILNLIGLLIEENETSSMSSDDDVMYMNFDPAPENMDTGIAETSDGYTVYLTPEPGATTPENYG
jgi:hypothetical protein